jgi:hypothetical protein
LRKISYNPLINLELYERIQGNPRKSNPQNLGFSQRNGHVPRKPKPGRRTASRPPSRRSQTDSIQMHSGLDRDGSPPVRLSGPYPAGPDRRAPGSAGARSRFDWSAARLRFHPPGADGPPVKRPCAWSSRVARRTISKGNLERSAISRRDWAPSERFSTHSMAIFSVAMSFPPMRL